MYGGLIVISSIAHVPAPLRAYPNNGWVRTLSK